MTARHRPWSVLDPDLAAMLRPALRPVRDAAILEIADQLPALGGDLSGDFGSALRRGIDLALGRLLDLFGTDDDVLEGDLAAVYESFGARESRHERPLDALLAAYRIGARAAWAHLSAAAVEGGVEVGQLVSLAEAIFVYIDELSGASANGHARDHAARAGHRDLMRSRLAEALIEGAAATAPAHLHELADDVGWVMPARMAVAVLPVTALSLPMAPPDVLTVTQDGEVLAVLPDPSGPGRRDRLSALVDTDGEVYVGTVRPPEEAPVSLAHARAVHRLVLDGVLPAAPVIAAADHLPELVLHADPRLLAELTARALAPLDGLPVPRQEVLHGTLRVWLAHQGNRLAVAEELGVHPQTVSYRLGQLHDLLGPAMDEPRGRLTLTLALGLPPAASTPTAAAAPPG
jgi:hypothetical protein